MPNNNFIDLRLFQNSLLSPQTVHCKKSYHRHVQLCSRWFSLHPTKSGSWKHSLPCTSPHLPMAVRCRQFSTPQKDEPSLSFPDIDPYKLVGPEISCVAQDIRKVCLNINWKICVKNKMTSINKVI